MSHVDMDMAHVRRIDSCVKQYSLVCVILVASIPREKYMVVRHNRILAENTSSFLDPTKESLWVGHGSLVHIMVAREEFPETGRLTVPDGIMTDLQWVTIQCSSTRGTSCKAIISGSWVRIMCASLLSLGQ